jgi:NOL1/NOP2/fmu family ribosome biogenesis protein
LHESSDPTREEVLAYFDEHFGVPPGVLSGLRFLERGVEIWAASAFPPATVRSRRPSGLRALRRRPDGLKPTSSFLMTLDRSVSRARLELPDGFIRRLLLGQRLPIDASDGYVALSFRGRIVGCGRVHRGAVQALIPTGRRRELLDALAQESRHADL